MIKQEICQSILSTLAFFDLFDRPLTLEELEIYLWRATARNDEIKQAVRLLLNEEIIVEQNGFFAFKRRKKIIPLHLRRRQISSKKLQIAKRAVKDLQWVPFLRGIFVIQSLALDNAKPSSDIDLLIVSAKNRLWLCRLLVIATIFVLGLRKSKHKKCDKICLGYYLVENGLNIQKTKLIGLDILTPYWIAWARPLYSFSNFFKFWQANAWVADTIPNFKLKLRSNLIADLVADSKILRDWRNLFEWLLGGIWGTIFNVISGKLQIWRIYSLPEARRPGANIRADDKMVELHHFSQRQEILRGWLSKTKNIELKNTKMKTLA